MEKTKRKVSFAWIVYLLILIAYAFLLAVLINRGAIIAVPMMTGVLCIVNLIVCKIKKKPFLYLKYLVITTIIFAVLYIPDIYYEVKNFQMDSYSWVYTSSSDTFSLIQTLASEKGNIFVHMILWFISDSNLANIIFSFLFLFLCSKHLDKQRKKRDLENVRNLKEL